MWRKRERVSEPTYVQMRYQTSNARTALTRFKNRREGSTSARGVGMKRWNWGLLVFALIAMGRGCAGYQQHHAAAAITAPRFVPETPRFTP